MNEAHYVGALDCDIEHLLYDAWENEPPATPPDTGLGTDLFCGGYAVETDELLRVFRSLVSAHIPFRVTVLDRMSVFTVDAGALGSTLDALRADGLALPSFHAHVGRW